MTLPPLLLDLDGTLVDSLADIAASANHVRAAFGLGPLGNDAVRGMIGDGAALLIERALAELDEPVDVAAAWPIYDEHHRQQCTDTVTPYPGVVACLEAWQGSGRKLAVVTNTPERFARQILEHLGIDGYFQAVVGGDTTRSRKPDPAPLHAALELLEAVPSEAWMVGDGIQDLRAGRAAGTRTIAALYGFRDAESLRAEGADCFWSAFGVEA
jgi:phosphoglycolate phosphatase